MYRKYHNQKTEVCGIKFDSKKEANYYLLLKEREEKGEILNLKRQVKFELIPSIWREEVKQLKTKTKIVRRCIQKATSYIADFVYTDPATEEDVVIDVKSKVTRMNAEYRLKKKMMLAFKGIEIKEV